MKNYIFNVYEKINNEDRIHWRLYLDAIYRSNPDIKDIRSEVLSKLMGVKNQGGFRYLGSTERPKLVVLFTSGEDIYWKDDLDYNTGTFLYYGDNKVPGTDIHKTNLNGNKILKILFDWACSNDIYIRKRIPPIFVFKKTLGRDVKFLGLAVPGIKNKPMKEWLTAVWASNETGDRFQNYKALFTIINTENGSEYEEGFGINLSWLNDIENNNSYESIYAPKEWKKYIDNKSFMPLTVKKNNYKKTKNEQLPSEKEKIEMLNVLHDYFIKKDNGYSFEKFSVNVLKYMDSSVIDINITRPYKDGGFDAKGKYCIFKNVENSVNFDFFVQAKCYALNNPVCVKDTSRLISRIKNKQFGVLITTSYVANQAYKEIVEDEHSVIIITGKDIIDFVFNELEIRNKDVLKNWLKQHYN